MVDLTLSLMILKTLKDLYQMNILRKTLITSLYVLREDNDILQDKNDYNTNLNNCDIVEFKIIGNKIIMTVNLY